jgi:copper oxidase (laccase) domain-containing protein
VESFPALDVLPGVMARFIGSIPGVAVAVERQEAMTRLVPHHQRLLKAEGLGAYPLVTAEQFHGNKISIVDETESDFSIAGVDGLLTQKRGITLGISVADCAPVWIVARNGTAGALLHSGKKGTELGIVPNGIAMLCNLTGFSPADLILVIGPCIRPPCYEVDFAAEIRQQAKQAGILDIHDDGVCTACHLDRYYSYRKEHGLTGRMLATLTLLPT